MAPVVLTGITVALHHLLRGRPRSWIHSALLAGLGMIVFMVVAIFASG
jgi:hypothetical protein